VELSIPSGRGDRLSGLSLTCSPVLMHLSSFASLLLPAPIHCSNQQAPPATTLSPPDPRLCISSLQLATLVASRAPGPQKRKRPITFRCGPSSPAVSGVGLA